MGLFPSPILNRVTTYSCRTEAFKYSSFHGREINETNITLTLIFNICNFNKTCSFDIFIANLIKIIRRISNSIFGTFNPLGLQLITGRQLGLNHLNKYRFDYNLNNCIDPLCKCRLGVDSTVYFFLHYKYYNRVIISFLNDLGSIDKTLLNISELYLVNVLKMHFV